VRVRDLQQLRPQGSEGQVDGEQDDHRDEEAREQTPDEFGGAVEQQRPGLDAVLTEGREHDRRGRRDRQTQSQQRTHGDARRGRTGRLGAGQTADRTLAELRMTAPGVELALEPVGHERRHIGTADGDHAEGQADRGAAQPRRQRFPDLPAGQERPARGVDRIVLGLAADPGGDEEHLAERQDATVTVTRETPSKSSGTPKVKRSVPETESIPMTENPMPSTRAMSPLSTESATTEEVATKAKSARAKNSAGPKLVDRSASAGAMKTTRKQEMNPPMNAPIAAVARACGARPSLAILWP